MTLKNLLLMALLIAGMIGTAGRTAAQDVHRVEVFGSFGLSAYADLFGPSSTAANFGGGIGVRPFSAEHKIAHRLGLEFEVDTESEKKYTGGLFSPAKHSGNRQQTLVLGDVLYHFTDGKAQPYILASFGAASSPSGNFAGGLAGGVKIFVARNVSLRPEFRFSGTSNAAISARGSMAVGFHW
jgi:hypothetical protein